MTDKEELMTALDIISKHCKSRMFCFQCELRQSCAKYLVKDKRLASMCWNAKCEIKAEMTNDC